MTLSDLEWQQDFQGYGASHGLSATAELLVKYKLLCHCMAHPPGCPEGPTALFTGVTFSCPIRMSDVAFSLRFLQHDAMQTRLLMPSCGVCLSICLSVRPKTWQYSDMDRYQGGRGVECRFSGKNRDFWRTSDCRWLWLAVWLSGNALASINVVALRQTRLVSGWVTVCGRVNHLGM